MNFSTQFLESSRSKKREDFLLKEVFPMAVAVIAAQRSKDPKTQVGACIVDDQNKILGYGYNGHPAINSSDVNNDDKYSWDDDEKHDFVCHAERNAIDYKTGSVRGATMYVTLYPCCECAKTIVQSGLKKLIYLKAKDSLNIKLDRSREILENKLPEKPIQFGDFLRQELGDEAAEKGFDFAGLNEIFGIFK